MTEPKRHFSIGVIVLILFNLFYAVCAGAESNEKTEKAVYEQSYKEVKEAFDNVKGKTDYLADNLEKFQGAIETWRNATTREAQKRGVEEVDDLLDNLNEDALKKLLETGLGEEAIKQLEEIEKTFGIKLSDQVNLWQLFRTDPRKAFDYMYNLSAFERTLRKDKVFDYIKNAQKYLKKGEGYLKTAGQMAEFVKVFDPTLTDPDSPTGSLRKLGGVLTYTKKFTDKIPAIGHVIDFYVQATEAFSDALDRLDKKVKEARQGALCGQIGSDKGIQKAFEEDCPDCDCLTYLSVNDEYPLLKPIRGWQGTEHSMVFLYLDESHHILVNSSTFATLYKYYAALKSSRFESNREIVSHEDLMSRAMSIGTKNISQFNEKFKQYYTKLEGDKSYNFRKVVEIAGVLKDFRIISPDSKAAYSVGSRLPDEFEALCFFNHGFRMKVEELINKYGKYIYVYGEVEPKDKKAEITVLELWIDHEVVRTIQCSSEKCKYEYYVEKDWEFKIWVHAKGFRDAYRKHKVTNELINVIPTIYLESSDCKDLLDLCNDFRKKREDVEEKVKEAYKQNSSDSLKSDLEDFQKRADPVNKELLRFSSEFSSRPDLLDAYTRLSESMKTMDKAVNDRANNVAFLEESIKGYLDYLRIKGDECLQYCVVCDDNKATQDQQPQMDVKEAYEKAYACIYKQYTLNAYIDDTIEYLKRRKKLIELFEKAKTAGEAALDRAKQLLKESGSEAGIKEKLDKAKSLLNEGKLDEAISLTSEVLGIDSRNAEAKSLNDKWIKERNEVKEHLGKFDKYLQDNKLADAERELEAARSLHPRYQPVLDAEKRLKDARKGVQACSYKYSEWGKCISETKKQTRTVIAKEPQGCVETEKPSLERDCKPASTEEEKPGEKPVSGDPKKLAEEKYQWIKGMPEYLEALIQLDEKTFMSFEKAVRKDVLGGIASGKYGAAPTPKECSGKGQSEMMERIAEIEKVLPNYYKCGMIIEDVLTKQKIWGCIDDPQYNKLASEKSVLEICLKGRDAETYWELKCIDVPAKERWEHKLLLKAKLAAVKDSKAYNNYQEYAAYGIYKDYLKIVDELKSALTLPDPIPSPPMLPWTYSNSCGSAGNVTSDQTKLTVTLKAGKQSLKREEYTDIAAGVKGGRSPYTYVWKGNYSGKGETVTFMSMKPGDHTLSVEVTDVTGGKGEASITLKVGGVTGTITGLAKQVVFGTWQQKVAVQAKTEDGKTITFAPAGKSKGSKKGAQYRVIWQSDPAVSLYPATSEDGKTDILFNQMGTNNKIKIWAEIQQLVGSGVYETIGEAEQKEVAVVPPKFRWTFAPEKGKGRVGQEVKVTITTDPKIKDELINYEWSYPESSNRMEYEKNARVIGFVPKDGKPFKLLVAPKSESNRDPVGGGLTEEYQVASYTVTITEPHYAASKPRIWKCDTQLGGAKDCRMVEVEYEFAVSHDIFMTAAIDPAPEKTPRYKWTSSPQGCRLMNDITREINVNCSKTGSYQFTVVVKDPDGIMLGEASQTLNVTISQETLNESKKKADEQTGAQNKINEAKELLNNGKIDEAVNAAEEAAKADPKSPMLQQFAQEAKKRGWDAVYNRDFEPAVKLLKTAVKLSPDDKDAKEKFEKAKKFQKIWPQVEQKAKEFDNLIAEKKVVTAYKKILEIQDLQHEMPGTMANKFSQNIMNTWHKANEEYNQFIQEALKRHGEYFDAMDWDGMLAHAQDVLKREHTEAEKKNWESNVNFAKQKISEQNQAWQYYQSVKSIFEKGDQTQAYGMLGDLNTKPQHFMKSDPRKQQILDLITALEKWHKIRSAKGYAMNLFFAGEQVLKDYHYGQAAEAFAEGLRAIRDNGDMNDPVYAKYYNLYQDCVAKDKRLKELFPRVQSAAMNEKPLPLETIEKALRGAEEMVALQPNNTDSQIYKSRLEQKIKNAQKEKENKALADALWKEGEGLFHENRYSDSLGKFKESLKLWSNQERQKYVSDLEKAIAAKKAKAKKLRDEGEALQKKGNLREAIGKYRESLTHWPDPALEEHIRMIETKISGEAEKKVKADSLWQEGTDFFNQNRLSDALDKFRESLGYWKNDTRVKYVRDLEAKLEEKKAKCRKLNDEGYSLQQQGRLKEALTRYREEAKYCPSPALEEHISKIEAEMLNKQNEQAKKECAKKNRDEGAALQQQGRLQEALAKYRESYNCLPTPEMEQHIKTIENMTTQTPTVSSAQVNLTGSWTAKCTGGDAYTAKVTQSGSSFEAQVDTEHYRGTITGNRISGKSTDQKDTISGEIISNNELRVVLTGYMGSSPITNTCTLTRGSSGSSIPKNNASGKTLSVRVKNSSGQNVHIYPQGGKCSTDNKLTPGQSRTITASIPSDGFLKFCAGRNGKDIECKKQGIDPGYSGYTYTVIFDESNPFKKLLIYTGLK